MYVECFECKDGVQLRELGCSICGGIGIIRVEKVSEGEVIHAAKNRTISLSIVPTYLMVHINDQDNLIEMCACRC